MRSSYQMTTVEKNKSKIRCRWPADNQWVLEALRVHTRAKCLSSHSSTMNRLENSRSTKSKWEFKIWSLKFSKRRREIKRKLRNTRKGSETQCFKAVHKWPTSCATTVRKRSGPKLASWVVEKMTLLDFYHLKSFQLNLRNRMKLKAFPRSKLTLPRKNKSLSNWGKKRSRRRRKQSKNRVRRKP